MSESAEPLSLLAIPSMREIKAVIIAGVIAESLFELYAWLISPILFGLSLQPSKLVMAITKITLGIDLPYGAAFVIHALIGSIGFALSVYLIHRVSKQTYLVAGVITGVLLWFIAQGILAPFIGRAFMMEFGAYTQSSFVGHVGMTVIVGLILRRLLQDRSV
ncbi:hypothetical protein [Granulosicoccus antarcticus]|uniref:DUF1440 domain-containing protein n=1 Tax=Granulosicoccus antarcticus IMCC3135 TaxID=1192854 RepID=A0A2Z2NG04_9GAMM|nr:hypothetical protein [Granulosicoccus antarcticus]ASJ70186.1 hypothetical protein IMCC3135_00300 [Granulosicoccus antarcticus IMCC3135]